MSSGKGLRELRAPVIQLHHDSQRHHWLVSMSTRGRLELCDSVKASTTSNDLARQLIQTYSNVYAEEGELPFYILPTQAQSGVDCGLHAAAVATQLCNGEDPTVHFSKQLLRPHLLDCLNNENTVIFPTIPRRRRKATTKKKSISTTEFSSENWTLFFLLRPRHTFKY